MTSPMAAYSSCSNITPPSPCSSLRSYRPYQCSVDSTSTTSPARFEHFQQTTRSIIPSRYATTVSNDYLIRDTSHYSRRQLSIEAVQCIFVDESQANGATYTFLVKPTLLQNSRAGVRSKARIDGSRVIEQITRADEKQEDEPEQQNELEPYHVEKTSKELLDLSNRLVTSFDVLLDPRRGGPVPLSKDLLLPKWNVKGIFRRKKKSGNMNEAQLAESTSVAKKDVVNDFFLKVLRTGGEVLSSSRAMQDFFDKSRSPIKVTKRDDKIAVPPERPARPVLSALQVGEIAAVEATENLTASVSRNSTPLSTPNSAVMSDTKLRLWRRMPADGAISTSTQKGKAGLLQHSASFTDTNLCTAQSEIMMGDVENNAELVEHSKKTQVQLNTLIRSISQQDLRNELTSWRREVSRASQHRVRKTSETSSMKIVLDNTSNPARGMCVKPSASPDSSSEFHSAQVLQVSAVAIKAKASGWKMIKGTEAPTRVTPVKKAFPEQTEFLSDSPGRIVNGDMSRQSHSSLAASFKSETQHYVPSELEKLIFGHRTEPETGHDGEDMAPRQQNEHFDIERTGDEEYMEVGGPRMSSEQTSSCSSSQSENIARYKVKGRAAVLRLNLSGRSNLHSESLTASAPLSKTGKLNDTISIHSTHNERVKVLTCNSRESWLDPDMSSSPQHTPSSAATTQSHLQYEAITLTIAASDIDHGNSSETTRVEKHIDKHLRSLTLASRGHASHVGEGLIMKRSS